MNDINYEPTPTRPRFEILIPKSIEDYGVQAVLRDNEAGLDIPFGRPETADIARTLILEGTLSPDTFFSSPSDADVYGVDEPAEEDLA